MRLSLINYPLIPAFDILIDGNRLDSFLHSQVVSLTVDDDLNKVSMFSFEIEIPHRADFDSDQIDHFGLLVGSPIEIRMGVENELSSLFKGEITALELSFYCDGPTMLIVRGYDRRHRLLRGTRIRTFSQQTDSRIAEQIAMEANLAAVVDDSLVVHEYVIQANQSDMEFLLDRAAAINYEVVVEDTTLYFRKAAGDKGRMETLKVGDDILEFHLRLASSQQVTAVTVSGWDHKLKSRVEATAHSLTGKIMGNKSGSSLSEGAFGNATQIITNHPVTSQAEADQIARALLNRQALTFIEGTGSCMGRADLKKGRMVEITGASKKFDGQYYITAVIHRCEHGDYRTEFTVRRNAIWV